ncbi:MAG: ATP-binding cassette domain-containing protein [Pseudomonadota bacterium]
MPLATASNSPESTPAHSSSATAVPAIDVADLRFKYGDNTIVDIQRFRLEHRQSLALIGPSGCGKTTFLYLLAGLLRPDAGTVRVLGQDLATLRGAALDRFRGQRIGLVFQRLHLLPALNVRENVSLAGRLSANRLDASRVTRLLEQLNLQGLERYKPSMLSQGQAQRVAIARALAHGPKLIIADEPTSALDDQNAEQALSLLRSSAESVGAALLVVTHDQRLRGCLNSEFELQVPA